MLGALCTGVRGRATRAHTRAIVEEENHYLTEAHANQESPVWAWNEWDTLEEVIVGRVEGATVPPFTVEVKVCSFTYVLPFQVAPTIHLKFIF